MKNERVSIFLGLAACTWCLPSEGFADTAGSSAAKSRPAAATRPADPAALRAKVDPAVRKGLRFLADSQAGDGGWPGMMPGPQPASDPAITALVAKAFLQHPDYGPTHAIVQRAVKFILTFRQSDGGIYSPEVGYANYATSVALMTLADLKDPALDAVIKAGRAFLTGQQWTEDKKDNDGKAIDPSHPWYGGAGYGQQKRPDLSNTQMMIEALHASGLPPSDPAYRKALTFIERCQMSSLTNDQPFARGATDGGFIYTPANGGESKAGTDTVAGRDQLRSYGSMTYAAFKSMLYAKVARQDPRVQQAWDWIRRHYTLEANPNMPGRQSLEGLYYYYHVFAKALVAWGEPVLVDEAGATHDWRAELCEQLLRRQRADGSWVNAADRWHEGSPYLVTAYALLALQTVTH